MNLSHINFWFMKIVGREKEMNVLWGLLDDTSVVLASIRRIGKSSVLKKMAEQPKSGWKAIFHPVSGVKSIDEFHLRFSAI